MGRLTVARSIGLALLFVVSSGCEPVVRLPVMPSTPDSNVSALDTEAWVQQAARDARDKGLDVSRLAPLHVLVAEGQATVWLRNYADGGEQVMARYRGDTPLGAQLDWFEARSPTLVGASAWEQARIEAALGGDPDVQSIVGLPITVLSVGFFACENGGACARARLAGSLIAPPPDGPGLAPIATVDMTTLDVSLLVPEFPIGDP